MGSAPKPVRGGARLSAIGALVGVAATLSPHPSVSATPARPAPAYPAFPSSRTVVGVRRWLAAQTDLPRRSPSFLTAASAFSLLDAKGGASPRLVRQEVFDGVLAGAMKGRSAMLSIGFDCARAAGAIESVEVFPGNNLKGGAPRSITPTQWQAANPEAELSDFALVACEAHPAGDAEQETQRPAQLHPTETTGASSKPESARPLEPSSGKAWAQIGAFQTAELAERRWRDLKAGLPGESQALSLRTEPASRSRLGLQRALAGPFGSAPEAKAFCAKAVARGFECFIRTLRSGP